jgi:large subunit ribosomal protein L15
MSLHTLSVQGSGRKARKRVGRGRSSGTGKTSGRGHKGQKSRSGYARKKAFEGGQMPLTRRIPKRGFNNPLGTVYTPINVGSLNRFEDGADVTPDTLRQARLANGRDVKIKILGSGGELQRRLSVKAHAFSASARRIIEASGGSCEVIR